MSIDALSFKQVPPFKETRETPTPELVQCYAFLGAQTTIDVHYESSIQTRTTTTRTVNAYAPADPAHIVLSNAPKNGFVQMLNLDANPGASWDNPKDVISVPYNAFAESADELQNEDVRKELAGRRNIAAIYLNSDDFARYALKPGHRLALRTVSSANVPSKEIFTHLSSDLKQMFADTERDPIVRQRVGSRTRDLGTQTSDVILNSRIRQDGWTEVTSQRTSTQRVENTQSTATKRFIQNGVREGYFLLGGVDSQGKNWVSSALLVAAPAFDESAPGVSLKGVRLEASGDALAICFDKVVAPGTHIHFQNTTTGESASGTVDTSRFIQMQIPMPAQGDGFEICFDDGAADRGDAQPGKTAGNVTLVNGTFDANMDSGLCFFSEPQVQWVGNPTVNMDELKKVVHRKDYEQGDYGLAMDWLQGFHERDVR